MQMLLEEPLLAWSEMLGLYWLASRSISYVTQIFLYFKKKKKKEKWESLIALTLPTVHVLMPPVWHLELHALEHL